MYVIDDICYAGNPDENIRVVDVSTLQGNMLLLTFSSGERKLFDCATLEGSAFTPLEDEELFQSAEVTHGFVSWAEGQIDIAPEYLYEHSIPYTGENDLLRAL